MSEPVTGSCTYAYSPTELYQHRDFGPHCGKLTYSAYVEVEKPEKQTDGSVQIVTDLVPREQADPYCPDHGGTRDPSEPTDGHTGDINVREKLMDLDDQLFVIEGRLEDLEKSKDKPAAGGDDASKSDAKTAPAKSVPAAKAGDKK